MTLLLSSLPHIIPDFDPAPAGLASFRPPVTREWPAEVTREDSGLVPKSS